MGVPVCLGSLNWPQGIGAARELGCQGCCEIILVAGMPIQVR